MKANKTIAAVTTSALTLAASAFAQGNVQDVQVVGPTSSPSNLQPLSAVSTSTDTVVTPPSTSSSTLGSLIALPQNPSAPATSTNPATPAPVVSPTPHNLTPWHRYDTNNVGDGVVNITHPVASPAASASPTTPVSGFQALSTDAHALGGVSGPNSFPAASASPVTTNIPIQGSQVNQTTQATATGAAPITPNQNVQIQGAQTNQTATGLTTNTAAKNITIKNSQANANTPAAVTTDKKGNAGNVGFNRHPKIKHTDDEQEGDEQGQHHQQKKRFADPQTQPQGNARGKGKPKPNRTPE